LFEEDGLSQEGLSETEKKIDQVLDKIEEEKSLEDGSNESDRNPDGSPK
jgi:hypothetical protein